MAADRRRDRTSMSLHPDLRDRLERLKPYEPMALGELVEEMADVYEAENGS